jgi:energy-coupling factor transporter ATP-binding protein EcfA2
LNVTSETPWLRLEGVAFRRAGRAILGDLSLGFERRELTLLTGHNGSGKTTLLRILAGLLQPDSFTLEFNGRRLNRGWRHCRQLLRSNSCYLHQQPYLFDATVYDNIAYGLKRKGVPGEQIRKQVDAALATTHLEHLAERHCQQLSGGEKQRVAMVRAWVLKPRLLLLDEPVANMDKPSRRQCYQLLNQMREDDIAVVLTSHDPQHGELDITRHLHLYEGKMSHKGRHFPNDQSMKS